MAESSLVGGNSMSSICKFKNLKNVKKSLKNKQFLPVLGTHTLTDLEMDWRRSYPPVLKTVWINRQFDWAATDSHRCLDLQPSIPLFAPFINLWDHNHMTLLVSSVCETLDRFIYL